MKLCSQSAKYNHEFTRWFSQAMQHFDVENASHGIDAYHEAKCAAIMMKRKAKNCSRGDETIEDGMSMAANWLMLAVLSRHKEAKIASKADSLLSDYRYFFSLLKTAHLPQQNYKALRVVAAIKARQDAEGKTLPDPG